MSIAACTCKFQRNKESALERGIAITSAFGVNDVITIVPWDGTTHFDIVKDPWRYQLDWHHSIDTSGLEGFKT